MPGAAGLIRPSKSWPASRRWWTMNAGSWPNSAAPRVKLVRRTGLRTDSPASARPPSSASATANTSSHPTFPAFSRLPVRHRLKGHSEVAGPGADRRPVSNVAGLHLSQGRYQSERKPEVCGVKLTAENLLGNGRKPRELRQLFFQLHARPCPILLVFVNRP